MTTRRCALRWPPCARPRRAARNLVPPMLDAARAEATLGEICGVLRDLWGGYVEPPTF